MSAQLTCQVPADGVVELVWRADSAPDAWILLIQRTGAVTAHTALRLSAGTTRYRIEHLSRHQRYRFCVLGLLAAGRANPGPLASDWWTVTPRAGLRPLPDGAGSDLATHLARARDLLVMPQHERLTAWWKLTPGFVDLVSIELWQADGSRLLERIGLEPEVGSLSLSAERGLPLRNGQACQIRVQTGFAGIWTPGPAPVVCAPARQGHERQANAALPQLGLVYPGLGPAEELDIFGDESQAQAGRPAADPHAAAILCVHCRRQVHWDAWRLRCSGCQAEFLPNGRGAFLDVARLRFGTCRCCLPPKILITRPGRENLHCVHSGKEHIRIPGQEGFGLIEDLPFGLCQCCRPRRPLERGEAGVRCSQSNEIHRNQAGRWALEPSAPVFDASAIDALLDAGLAEISSTGVTKARRKRKGGSS